MDQQKANLYNFIVTISSDEGDSLDIYVPQPNELELKLLAPILGKFFTAVREKRYDTMVLLYDWELTVEEALEGLNEEKKENLQKRLNTFFERSIASMTINGQTELSETEMSLFKGTLLFISALYRYSTKTLLTKELGEFFTSLSSTEWLKSLTSSTEVVETKEQKKKPSVRV